MHVHGRGPVAVPASNASLHAHQADADDDEGAPYRGSELADFELKNSLSAKEREHLAQGTRRRGAEEEEEAELKPLAPALKAATAGKVLEATRGRDHGPGLEGLCCSVNADGDTAVVGCHDSKLLVVNTHTMELMQTIDLGRYEATLPSAAPTAAFKVPNVRACTSVRYSSRGTGASGTVVLAAQGTKVLHVHVSTGKVLSSVEEAPSKVYNIVVRPDGGAFATCGSDQAVRLYDEQTCKLTCKLDHGDDVNTTGHSNDVFGLAWSDEDPNVLVSAGWDHTVQVWDVRLQRSVRSIYGPYVCGDSLDVQGGAILAGSWRHASPLELWDLGSCKLLTRLPFHQPEQDACKLYAAGFARGAARGTIFAGGSGKRPCVKVFSKGGELVGTCSMPSGVNNIAAVALPQDRFLAVCCSSALKVVQLPN